MEIKLFGFYVTYPTLRPYERIWISAIQPDFVVITPPYMCAQMVCSDNSPYTCINMKFVGVLALLSDAKVYKMKFYL